MYSGLKSGKMLQFKETAMSASKAKNELFEKNSSEAAPVEPA